MKDHYLTLIPLVRRYIDLAYHVLKTEGLNSLLSLIASKFFKQKRHEIQANHFYRLDKHICPLIFPQHDSPKISIIVFSDKDVVLTFSCLKSIWTHSKNISYEILISDDNTSFFYTQLLRQMKNIHFINNNKNSSIGSILNTCALRAKGEYLIFLKNTIMVEDNWFQPLLDVYIQEKNTGVVSSRLLHPYNLICESGCILYSDGSVFVEGNNRHPDTPEFCYLKKISGCSGKLCIVPKKLYEELFGLNSEYHDLMYAFSDLSLKAERKGKINLYQPFSKGICFDKHTAISFTSNPDRDLFYKNWHSELDYRRNCKNKCALVVDMWMITPDQDSGSYRMMSLLQLLKDIGFQVSFASVDLDYQQQYVQQLQTQGICVLYRPFIESMEQYIYEYGKTYDVILISRVHVANRLMDHVKTYAPQAFVIFDTVDLHFLRETRQADIDGSPAIKEEALQRKSQELSSAEKANVTFVVSPVEKKILEQINPELSVEILSNIHEIFGSNVPFLERKHLLFIGGFKHLPNVDAMLYYKKEIFPLIKNKQKGIKTVIVGSHPPQEILDLRCDDIIVTGYVKDIAPYFNMSRVFIAPLRYGAGVKGKINMSMCYGLPVIGTSIAVEGMYLRHGENVLIADSPDVFAERVIELYTNEQLWNIISKNGIKNIETYFSRDVAKKTLQKVLA